MMIQIIRRPFLYMYICIYVTVSVYAIQEFSFCIQIKYEITDPFVHDRILIASWKTAYTRYVGNP